ncbi:MAG TPA: trypsin-like peptidase domain-containing protein [Thermoguttaceae bacterium]|nr:trypsin-like peptidase domain-containing protein [Thermoguttaceae bacterium]
MGNFDVRVFLSILAILASGAPAAAWPAASPPKHPAVVRVVVPEGGGNMSLGSGALVAVSEEYGLVVTNWHVVRDGYGTGTVIFPDGFRSPATVVRTDRDWDLAALVIWRPRVRPIPLCGRPPAIGDPLWIAGYGRGEYRIAGGQCTHYLSPGGQLPFDMIELSTGARQGDSGGPILNQQGELAGVLFGAAWGKTSGSHCVRVKQFLDPVLYRFDAVPRNDGTMLARRDGNGTVAPSRGGAAETPVAMISGIRNAPTTGLGGAATAPGRSAPWVASSPGSPGFMAPPAPGRETTGRQIGVRPDAPYVRPAASNGPIPSDAWEQGKTVLAILGLLAVCFHTLRWIGK